MMKNSSATEADTSRISHYDNQSDPTLHRKGQEVLLASNSGEQSPIVVFCPYAGKQGRPRPENNHNRTVEHSVLSGTVLWLVCPYVNNLIARLERSGGVKLIDARLKSDDFLGPLHEASHRIYESYVTTSLLKDPEEQNRFLKMFVMVGDSATTGQALDAGNTRAGNWNRKFGNAGVSSPRDLKCFHAVAAQALGGAANPVGCVVVLYIFHLYEVLQQIEDEERAAEAAEEAPAPVVDTSQKYEMATATATGKPDPGAPSRRSFAAKKSKFATFVDDFGNFESFLNDCISQRRLVFDEATSKNLPKLSDMCKEMLHALEGHQPYHRKKRRVH